MPWHHVTVNSLDHLKSFDKIFQTRQKVYHDSDLLEYVHSNQKIRLFLLPLHDLTYRAVCATDNCIEDYVGETARQIVERAIFYNGQY